MAKNKGIVCNVLVINYMKYLHLKKTKLKEKNSEKEIWFRKICDKTENNATGPLQFKQ